MNTDAQDLQVEWIEDFPVGGFQSRNWILTDDQDDVYHFGRTVNPLVAAGFLSLKYSSAGDFLWEATFDNPNNETIQDCVMTASGPIVGGLDQNGPETNQSKIIHYDFDGNINWEKYLSIDNFAISVDIRGLETSDGNDLFAFGSFTDFQTSEISGFINRLDPVDGTTIWSNISSDPDNTITRVVDGKIINNQLISLLSNNQYSAVSFQSGTYYLKRMALNGTDISIAAFDLPDGYLDFSFDQEGNCIFGGSDISKVNLEGVTEWSFDFSEGDQNMEGLTWNIETSLDGNIYASGILRIPDSLEFAKILALDSSGSKLWSHTFDVPSIARKIVINNDILAAGVSIRNIQFPSIFNDNVTLFDITNGSLLASYNAFNVMSEIINTLHLNSDTIYLSSYTNNFNGVDGNMTLTKLIIDNPVNVIEQSDENIVLFPNPTTGAFSINMPDYFGAMDVRIFDLSGQEIGVFPISNSNQNIDLSMIPNGIYIVCLVKDHDCVWSQKMVLERFP